MTAGRHTDVPVVDAAELARRVIEPDDFVADTQAFVDVRLPRSAGKASYSFIGPGVSQNADQVVNLVEPHGFNIGAASMPHGVVNNAHLHFTAEVFVCTRGRFLFTVGEHGDQQLEVGAGTIFSVPTWIFRGFENLGGDDGWLFTVLGGDDTGGILWAPHVLVSAAETGLYLAPDWSVVEANGGDPGDVVRPLTDEQLRHVDTVSDDDLLARAVTSDALVWSERALLSSVLPGHDVAVAPVIGAGLGEDRHQRAPMLMPHGFSVEWIRIAPGSTTGRHRHDDSQVLLLVSGEFELSLNDGDQRVAARPNEGSVVSVPAGAWRDLANVGTADALAVVVCGGDHPTSIEWAPEIVAAARVAGWTHDASGYLAPADLVGGDR